MSINIGDEQKEHHVILKYIRFDLIISVYLTSLPVATPPEER